MPWCKQAGLATSWRPGLRRVTCKACDWYQFILTCRSTCSRCTAPSQGDLVTSSITPAVLGRGDGSAWPFASLRITHHTVRCGDCTTCSLGRLQGVTCSLWLLAQQGPGRSSPSPEVVEQKLPF